MFHISIFGWELPVPDRQMHAGKYQNEAPALPGATTDIPDTLVLGGIEDLFLHYIQNILPILPYRKEKGEARDPYH